MKTNDTKTSSHVMTQPQKRGPCLLFPLAGLMLAMALSAFFCLHESAAYEECAFIINGRTIDEGSTIVLSNDDLIDGSVGLAVRAPAEVVSMEISLDSGKKWRPMTRRDDMFTYTYYPREGEPTSPVFIYKTTDGNVTLYSTGSTVKYRKYSYLNSIASLLEYMKKSYETRDKKALLECISSAFPDLQLFSKGIENDFTIYNDAHLYYRVERKRDDPELGEATWVVYWERQYENGAGNNFNDSATITMAFRKLSDGWKIENLEGNTIFGSPAKEKPELSIATSDIIGGYGLGGDYMIAVTVENSGRRDADNVPVNFIVNSALEGTKIIATIPAESYATTELSLGRRHPPVGLVRIVIDPAHTIPEENIGNNVATRAL